MALYRDRWICCDDQGITIRAYYFGNRIRPFLTPDDLDAVAQVVHRKAGVTVSTENSGEIV